MPVGEPRNRRKDRRNLAAERRQKKQPDLVAARKGTTHRVQVARRNILWTKKTRDYRGPLKKSVASRKGATRSAAAAQHRGEFIKKDRTTTQTERGTPKRRKEGEKLWKSPKCNTGTKDLTTKGIQGWGSGRWSHLGSGGTHKNALYEIFRSKIMEQVVGTSSELRKMRKWTLWSGRPPPKRKKEQEKEEEPVM
jgi:hypothetical protein